LAAFPLRTEEFLTLAQGLQKLEGSKKCLSTGGVVKVDTGSSRDGLDDYLAFDSQLIRDMQRTRPGVRRPVFQRKRVVLERTAMRAEGHVNLGRLTFDMSGKQR